MLGEGEQQELLTLDDLPHTSVLLDILLRAGNARHSYTHMHTHTHAHVGHTGFMGFMAMELSKRANVCTQVAITNC
jgi:hypothetical protein